MDSKLTSLVLLRTRSWPTYLLLATPRFFRDQACKFTTLYSVFREGIQIKNEYLTNKIQNGRLSSVIL